MTRALLLALAVAWIAVPLGAGEDESKVPTPKQIKSLLKQAIVSGDEASLMEVLTKISGIRDGEAARAVLSLAQSLPENEDRWYWILLDGVATFKRPEAYTEMGEWLVRHRSHAISRDLIHALSANRSKYVNRVIRRIMNRGTLEQKLMALDLAQHIHARRTVDVLMPHLEAEDATSQQTGKNSVLKKKLIATLEVLTLQRFGDSLPNWQSWWGANRYKGLQVLRDEADESRGPTGVNMPLDPLREKEWVGMEDLPNGRVLVIKGATARNGNDSNFDHIENVLERLRVKHDVVEKDRLLEPGFSLKRYAAVFINCTQINPFCQSPGHQAGEFTGNRLHKCMGPAPHDTFRGRMKPEGVEKIRKWVRSGGYLFTEDWVLMEVLESAFPKFVRGGESLTDGTVGIRPARGQTSHYMLRGVFVPPVDVDRFVWDEDDDEDDEEEADKYDPAVEDDPGDGDIESGRTRVGEVETPEDVEDIADVQVRTVRHKWKIDNESPSIHVRSKKVRVLISSSDLKKQVGDPAVAVLFDVGKGRVVHVLSHFGKQHSRVDEATLENFLINFLIDVKVKVMGG